jgi:phospholipid/cholesterol/gamma-HCH transport system substrate-binding protein
MRGNVLETVMGAVVLVVAALFLLFAYNTSQLRQVSGYQVSADFERVDGIHQGSDVRISGIKIGSVASEVLDPKTFMATLAFSIEPAIKLPDDTVAEVVSSSLLGDKYVSLVPGGSDKDIPAGGKIKYTQSSVNIDHLIGQMIFSAPGGKKPEGAAAPGDKKPEGGAAAPQAPGAAAPQAPGAAAPAK